MITKVVHLAFLGTMLLSLLYGQIDSGRIVGNVTDATGASVPNAVITVKNEKTSQERKQMADSVGYYIFANLAPSSYSVSGQASGFGVAEFRAIPLSVGQERTLEYRSAARLGLRLRLRFPAAN